MVRISRMHYPVTALGPGRRLAVWVQGCTLGCPGCASRDTWDPAGGDLAQTSDALRIWSAVLEDGADGLTVSGGEPLQQAEGLADLLDALAGCTAESGRTADVLLYTGYDAEEIPALGPAAARVVEHADALVTGRFRADQPTSLIWRGSANQRLIPRTGLGRARYGEYVERTESATRLQVNVDEQDVQLIGIPRRRDLARIERSLRSSGVMFGDVSWRP